MMNLWKGTVRRVGATLLACVLLLGLLPQLPRQAGAAYTDSYLQQMVDWGFMRGDISGNLRPDNPISRAEFVTAVSCTHLDVYKRQPCALSWPPSGIQPGTEA